MIENVEKCREVYRVDFEHGCGGHLHIVLDDQNISDSDIKYCINSAKSDNCQTCVEAGEMLLEMNINRRKILVERYYKDYSI